MAWYEYATEEEARRKKQAEAKTQTRRAALVPPRTSAASIPNPFSPKPTPSLGTESAAPPPMPGSVQLPMIQKGWWNTPDGKPPAQQQPTWFDSLMQNPTVQQVARTAQPVTNWLQKNVEPLRPLTILGSAEVAGRLGSQALFDPNNPDRQEFLKTLAAQTATEQAEGNPLIPGLMPFIRNVAERTPVKEYTPISSKVYEVADWTGQTIARPATGALGLGSDVLTGKMTPADWDVAVKERAGLGPKASLADVYGDLVEPEQLGDWGNLNVVRDWIARNPAGLLGKLASQWVAHPKEYQTEWEMLREREEKMPGAIRFAGQMAFDPINYVPGVGARIGLTGNALKFVRAIDMAQNLAFKGTATTEGRIQMAAMGKGMQVAGRGVSTVIGVGMYVKTALKDPTMLKQLRKQLKADNGPQAPAMEKSLRDFADAATVGADKGYLLMPKDSGEPFTIQVYATRADMNKRYGGQGVYVENRATGTSMYGTPIDIYSLISPRMSYHATPRYSRIVEGPALAGMVDEKRPAPAAGGSGLRPPGVSMTQDPIRVEIIAMDMARLAQVGKTHNLVADLEEWFEYDLNRAELSQPQYVLGFDPSTRTQILRDYQRGDMPQDLSIILNRAANLDENSPNYVYDDLYKDYQRWRSRELGIADPVILSPSQDFVDLSPSDFGFFSIPHKILDPNVAFIRAGDTQNGEVVYFADVPTRGMQFTQVGTRGKIGSPAEVGGDFATTRGEYREISDTKWAAPGVYQMAPEMKSAIIKADPDGGHVRTSTESDLTDEGMAYLDKVEAGADTGAMTQVELEKLMPWARIYQTPGARPESGMMTIDLGGKTKVFLRFDDKILADISGVGVGKMREAFGQWGFYDDANKKILGAEGMILVATGPKAMKLRSAMLGAGASSVYSVPGTLGHEVMHAADTMRLLTPKAWDIMLEEFGTPGAGRDTQIEEVSDAFGGWLAETRGMLGNRPPQTAGQKIFAAIQKFFTDLLDVIFKRYETDTEAMFRRISSRQGWEQARGSQSDLGRMGITPANEKTPESPERIARRIEEAVANGYTREEINEYVDEGGDVRDFFPEQMGDEGMDVAFQQPEGTRKPEKTQEGPGTLFPTINPDKSLTFTIRPGLQVNIPEDDVYIFTSYVRALERDKTLSPKSKANLEKMLDWVDLGEGKLSNAQVAYLNEKAESFLNYYIHPKPIKLPNGKLVQGKEAQKIISRRLTQFALGQDFSASEEAPPEETPPDVFGEAAVTPPQEPAWVKPTGTRWYPKSLEDYLRILHSEKGTQPGDIEFTKIGRARWASFKAIAEQIEKKLRDYPERRATIISELAKPDRQILRDVTEIYRSGKSEGEPAWVSQSIRKGELSDLQFASHGVTSKEELLHGVPLTRDQLVRDFYVLAGNESSLSQDERETAGIFAEIFKNADYDYGPYVGHLKNLDDRKKFVLFITRYSKPIQYRHDIPMIMERWNEIKAIENPLIPPTVAQEAPYVPPAKVVVEPPAEDDINRGELLTAIFENTRYTGYTQDVNDAESLVMETPPESWPLNPNWHIVREAIATAAEKNAWGADDPLVMLMNQAESIREKPASNVAIPTKPREPLVLDKPIPGFTPSTPAQIRRMAEDSAATPEHVTRRVTPRGRGLKTTSGVPVAGGDESIFTAPAPKPVKTPIILRDLLEALRDIYQTAMPNNRADINHALTELVKPGTTYKQKMAKNNPIFTDMQRQIIREAEDNARRNKAAGLSGLGEEITAPEETPVEPEIIVTTAPVEEAAPAEEIAPTAPAEETAPAAEAALPIKVDVADVPMYYKMAAGDVRSGLRKKYPKGTTTAELVANGDRTATTRSKAIGKLGQIVTFKGVPGVYRITNIESVDLDSLEGRKKWVAREGWDLIAVQKRFGKQVKTGAIQTVFERVNEPAAVSAESAEPDFLVNTPEMTQALWKRFPGLRGGEIHGIEALPGGKTQSVKIYGEFDNGDYMVGGLDEPGRRVPAKTIEVVTDKVARRISATRDKIDAAEERKAEREAQAELGEEEVPTVDPAAEDIRRELMTLAGKADPAARSSYYEAALAVTTKSPDEWEQVSRVRIEEARTKIRLRGEAQGQPAAAAPAPAKPTVVSVGRDERVLRAWVGANETNAARRKTILATLSTPANARDGKQNTLINTAWKAMESSITPTAAAPATQPPTTAATAPLRPAKRAGRVEVRGSLGNQYNAIGATGDQTLKRRIAAVIKKLDDTPQGPGVITALAYNEDSILNGPQRLLLQKTMQDLGVPAPVREGAPAPVTPVVVKPVVPAPAIPAEQAPVVPARPAPVAPVEAMPLQNIPALRREILRLLALGSTSDDDRTTLTDTLVGIDNTKARRADFHQQIAKIQASLGVVAPAAPAAPVAAAPAAVPVVPIRPSKPRRIAQVAPPTQPSGVAIAPEEFAAAQQAGHLTGAIPAAAPVVPVVQPPVIKKPRGRKASAPVTELPTVGTTVAKVAFPISGVGADENWYRTTPGGKSYLERVSESYGDFPIGLDQAQYKIEAQRLSDQQPVDQRRIVTDDDVKKEYPIYQLAKWGEQEGLATAQPAAPAAPAAVATPATPAAPKAKQTPGGAPPGARLRRIWQTEGRDPSLDEVRLGQSSDYSFENGHALSYEDFADAWQWGEGRGAAKGLPVKRKTPVGESKRELHMAIVRAAIESGKAIPQDVLAPYGGPGGLKEAYDVRQGVVPPSVMGEGQNVFVASDGSPIKPEKMPKPLYDLVISAAVKLKEKKVDTSYFSTEASLGAKAWRSFPKMTGQVGNNVTRKVSTTQGTLTITRQAVEDLLTHKVSVRYMVNLVPPSGGAGAGGAGVPPSSGAGATIGSGGMLGHPALTTVPIMSMPGGQDFLPWHGLRDEIMRVFQVPWVIKQFGLDRAEPGTLWDRTRKFLTYFDPSVSAGRLPYDLLRLNGLLNAETGETNAFAIRALEASWSDALKDITVGKPTVKGNFITRETISSPEITSGVTAKPGAFAPGTEPRKFFYEDVGREIEKYDMPQSLRNFFDLWDRIEREYVRRAEAEGVKVPQLELGKYTVDGVEYEQRYYPRAAWALEGTRYRTPANHRYTKRPDITMEDMILDKDVMYRGPMDAIRSQLSGYANAISGHYMREAAHDWGHLRTIQEMAGKGAGAAALENARTTTLWSPDAFGVQTSEPKISIGTFTEGIPWLNGLRAPIDEVRALEAVFKLPEKGPAVEKIAKIIDFSRFFKFSMDLAVFTKNLNGMFLVSPKIGAKVTWETAKDLVGSLSNRSKYLDFVNSPDVQAFLRKAVPKGFKLENPTDIMATFKDNGLLQKWERRGVGELSARLYAYPINYYKIMRGMEEWDNAVAKGQEAELCKALDDYTATTSAATLGVPKKDRMTQSLLLISPRNKRVMFTTLRDAWKGGVTGKFARQKLIGSLGTTVLAGAMAHILSMIVQGEDPLDPQNWTDFVNPATGGAWLGTDFYGHRISVGDQFLSLTKLGIEVGKMWNSNRSGLVSLDNPRMNHPIVRWLISQENPIPGLVTDTLAGRDMYGNPMDAFSPDMLRNILEAFAPTTSVSMVEAGRKAILRGADTGTVARDTVMSGIGGITGVNVNPPTDARARNRLRDEYAQKEYTGKKWSELDYYDQWQLSMNHEDLRNITGVAQATNLSHADRISEFYDQVQSIRDTLFNDPVSGYDALVQHLYRGDPKFTGRTFRLALNELYKSMSQVAPTLKKEKQWADIPITKEEKDAYYAKKGMPPLPEPPILNRFVEAWHQLPLLATDADGQLDIERLGRLQTILQKRFNKDTVDRGLKYIYRNKPTAVRQAQEEFQEYAKLPLYAKKVGGKWQAAMTDADAREANRAITTVNALRTNRPKESMAKTLKIFYDANPNNKRAYQLAKKARQISTKMQGGPRKEYRLTHKLMQLYYSEIPYDIWQNMNPDVLNDLTIPSDQEQ